MKQPALIKLCILEICMSTCTSAQSGWHYCCLLVRQYNTSVTKGSHLIASEAEQAGCCHFLEGGYKTFFMLISAEHEI